LVRSFSPTSAAAGGPLANKRKRPRTSADRSTPSGQSVGVACANACSQRSTVVSGASLGMTRGQSRGKPARAGDVLSKENKRRTRSCEMPLTRASARAAAVWPS
jgi:hypothetical protein